MKTLEPKPKRIARFSLEKSFNQTAAVDLKEWSSSPKICFLHLTDHFTRVSVSCVVYTKRKENIIEKIFEAWISTFVYADKFLDDDGGEFDNDHLYLSVKI